MAVAPGGRECTPASALVSVILAARNAASTIGAQLEALAGQTYDGSWELVFIDDGSQDRTRVIVEDWRERLPRLLSLVSPCRVAPTAPARRGRGLERTVSTARNHGVAHSGGDLLLFCDADDVVDPAWIEHLVDGLLEHPAVGGQIERERLSTLTALAVRPPKGSRLLDGGFGFLRYPMGANCGMRRDVWTALDGFAESYDNSEDVELFWRAQLAGYELGYVHDAVVHYRLRSDARAMAVQAYFFGRSHPRLFRDFRASGMPRSSVPAAVREWRWLARHVCGNLRDEHARARRLSRLALRLGRLVGSVRNRVLYL
ncbi:MAG TPA: glycosyltransferase [Solirubrobacteraceae bacterium]|nr:glycosyltransferase [Solirubrobacteraceae bacterium]